MCSRNYEMNVQMIRVMNERYYHHKLSEYLRPTNSNKLDGI